jgi:hypothetical protein
VLGQWDSFLPVVPSFVRYGAPLFSHIAIGDSNRVVLIAACPMAFMMSNELFSVKLAFRIFVLLPMD